MEFDLKWVHVAPFELILKLDGALWLRIISGPLLTQKWSIQMNLLCAVHPRTRSGISLPNKHDRCP